MKTRLLAGLTCVALGGCGGAPDAPSDPGIASAGENDARPVVAAPRPDTVSVGSNPRRALERAERAADDIEDALRRRTDEADRVARQVRIDAQNTARDRLARLERERDARRKSGADVPRELRVSEDET